MGRSLVAKGYLPNVGYATRCEVVDKHWPRPLRYVWHHILPQQAGGPTTPTNLAQLCDNCHYAVHHLMWMLKEGAAIPGGMKRSRRYHLALQGYQAAVAAGTVDRIPNEG